MNREPEYQLGPLNLDFTAGRIYTFVGENGSGKSTLLASIYGELPFSGILSWAGKDLTDDAPYERPFTYVRQDFPLLEMYSVSEILLLSHAFRNARGDHRTLWGLGNGFGAVLARDQERAELIAHLIGLGDLMKRRPTGLSGGQRQRVAIAAALSAVDKQVILLDEPTSALGTAEIKKLIGVLNFRLSESPEPLIIIATHDLAFVDQLPAVRVHFTFDRPPNSARYIAWMDDEMLDPIPFPAT